MKINLSREQILKYAALYVYADDSSLCARMDTAVKRGYMTLEDLNETANWKWRGGRTRQLCAQNTEAETNEITSVSFAAKSERLRIGALLSLSGVQWPMASVILHFAYPNKYPILDVRAMNTVGGSKLYTFEKWLQYVELCRNAIATYDVTMRTLDKALWAYDKAHQ